MRKLVVITLGLLGAISVGFLLPDGWFHLWMLLVVFAFLCAWVVLMVNNRG